METNSVIAEAGTQDQERCGNEPETLLEVRAALFAALEYIDYILGIGFGDRSETDRAWRVLARGRQALGILDDKATADYLQRMEIERQRHNEHEAWLEAHEDERRNLEALVREIRERALRMASSVGESRGDYLGELKRVQARLTAALTP